MDTKYEFGLVGDEVILIDEVHTPDSSRFWYADTYEQLFAAGKDQRALDKEPLREWFVERGFRGDGPAPPCRMTSGSPLHRSTSLWPRVTQQRSSDTTRREIGVVGSAP